MSMLALQRFWLKTWSRFECKSIFRSVWREWNRTLKSFDEYDWRKLKILAGHWSLITNSFFFKNKKFLHHRIPNEFGWIRSDSFDSRSRIRNSSPTPKICITQVCCVNSSDFHFCFQRWEIMIFNLILSNVICVWCSYWTVRSILWENLVLWARWV